MPPIVTRAQWGAAPPKTKPLPLTRFDGWHIHWLGDAYPDDATDDQILTSVQRYHQETKGWADIGYSFAVGRMHPEAVYECRGFGVAGSHTQGHNSTSMGIVVLIGDGEQPNPIQLATVRQFIDTHSDRWPYRWVRPHSATKPTACPGPDLTAWIEAGLPLEDRTMTDTLPADHPGARIQRAVNANGLQPPLTVDGRVGPVTADGVDAVLRWLNQRATDEAAATVGAKAEYAIAVARARDLAAQLAGCKAELLAAREELAAVTARPAATQVAELRALVVRAQEVLGL